MYGKDTSGKNVYAQLNNSDSNALALLEVHVYDVGGLVFVDFWSRQPFSFEITLQGKKALKDIGYGVTKKLVASSIKGVTIVWNDFLLGPDPDQDVKGTATASASLYTAETKLANAGGWTEDEIINGPNGLIAQKLKGYSLATLPVITLTDAAKAAR